MRKILTLLFLLLFCVSSTAQNLPQQPQPLPSDSFFIIDDFSKMLYSHESPYNITHGEAQDTFNVRANEQYGALTKRQALSDYGTCNRNLPVTGLYRYYKSDGTKFTLTTSGVFLDYLSDSNVCSNIYASLTTGRRPTFITYKNWAIISNGFDQPLKWDGNLVTTADTAGARTAGDSVTQLGAAFAKIATGTGLTASKWYQYRMAFYDGVTYKFTNARTNPLLLGTVNKQITLTDIPIGPPGTTHRYIYRTTGDASRAGVIADNATNLVTDIADNTTTTYTDVMTDATLAANTAPTWATVSAGVNVTTPHGLYLFINKDYIWLANDPSGVPYGQSTAYFSQVFNPDYWNNVINNFVIRPDDGDVITGITSFLGDLTVFKTNTIQKIFTNSSASTSWTVSQPFSFLGATAPYSIVSTPLGIIYLGRYGLYRFDGQQSGLISDIVTRDIKDINTANLNNAAAVYFNNEYRLAYASRLSGSQSNNRVLVFDSVRNSFVKDTENVNVWSVFNSSDDFGGLYCGYSTNLDDIASHSTQPTTYNIRFLSDLNQGTFAATVASGIETNPVLALGWDSTWATALGTWAGQGAATWLIKTSPGTWLSPIIQVNANGLQKLFWNAQKPTGTNITFAVRSASTSAGIAGASWSAEFSDPAGSDISGVPANVFIQLRATFTTSDFTVQPQIVLLDNFLIKFIYTQVGVIDEPSVPSSWLSGWLDLVPSPYLFYLSNMPKVIKEVDIYYEGTSGILNVTMSNLKGTNSINFTVDLSRNPMDTQNYWGFGGQKIFRWLSPASGGTFTGDKFLMSITESGLVQWKIQRIAIRYDVLAYSPYKNN